MQMKLSKFRRTSASRAKQSMNSFLDDDGLIRIGGRIKTSFLFYDKKHSIVMPKKRIYTITLIEQLYFDNNHAGPKAERLRRQKYTNNKK